MSLPLLNDRCVVCRNFSLDITCGIGAVLPVEFHREPAAVPFADLEIRHVCYLKLRRRGVGGSSFEEAIGHGLFQVCFYVIGGWFLFASGR